MKAKRGIRSLSALAPLALLAGLLATGGAAASPSSGTGGERVKVIGVFHDSVGDPRGAAQDLEHRHNGRLDFVYESAIKGFAGEFPRASLSGLERDGRVDYVELDQVVSIAAQQQPTGIERIFAPGNGEIDIDATDDFRVDADVAVIDTGIDLDHPDLNVVASTDCFHSTSSGPPWARDYFCGSGGDDDNGHGTHVGGTIGAIDNGIGVVGVAPGARLWAVKVLDQSGSGYMSNIVAGIDYVTANAVDIEVANMSLGCECSSSALNDAIAASVDAGVVYAVAAGNSDKDSSTFSPANHPDVITVSALADFDGLVGGLGSPTCRTDEDDTLANFSNFGSGIEIAAPGVCILSTYPGGGLATYSGTSMASPHVAGAAALRAATDSSRSPSQIRNDLIGAGNFSWTDDSGDGIKEPLLDVSNTTLFNPGTVPGGGGGGGGGGTTNSPPSASFTESCTGLTCDFTDTSTDPDGNATIASWSWDFNNDGVVDSTLKNPSHTYSAEGTYTVALSVSDGDLSDSTSKQVTVSEAPAGGDFTLSTTGYKVKGVQHADLTWSGATSTNVDVYRDDALIATTANDGSYTDNTGGRGNGSYTYQLCEADSTTVCSNESTVVFG